MFLLSGNDQPSQPAGFSLVFESVLEKEIGFSPTQPWLGSRSFDELANRIINRDVEMRMLRTGVVMFWEQDLGIGSMLGAGRNT